MIKLYQFDPAFGLPNASPFCMKLETYLRMAQLPFEIPAASLSALGKAPKGKMPYIDDGGKIVADTTFIIDHLKATYGDPLDGWLSTEQRAVALAFQRLIEENLYWAVVHTRWIEPQGWVKTKAAFFAALPVPLKWVVPTLARRGLVKELHGHGMGRHSENEIHAIGQRDITALADYLGEKPYFMGEQPCALDATVYAFVANLLWAPVESVLKQHALQYPKLEAYCARMRSRYYP
ncbi:glutathione S-transferase family protein [Rhodoferax sp.]|uniref:glutathione S-transferase family protein n=1 Tax=Rhodoferax sp. TaxID=50421 RepID=UPI002742BE6D|nr:glutathione S-transferase family protein [Rhodoferax sp.]